MQRGVLCRVNLGVMDSQGSFSLDTQIGETVKGSAELSHSLEVSDRRRNTPKSGQNRSELVCASLWAPSADFWFGFVQFGTDLGPKSAISVRIPENGSVRIPENGSGPFSSGESERREGECEWV